ncbi:MAG: radical SAM protein, partial [bacterium]
LFKCDLVSLKLDAGSEKTWRAINRPPETFAWEDFEVGMRSFAQKFAGRCITETMVLRGMNDSLDDFEQVGTLLQSIHPDTAYLAIPTRPPAEDWVRPPDENRLFLAYQIFSKIPEIREVQFLVGDEGNDFVPGEDPLRDLLAILAVHPMREEAMEQYLDRIHSGWDLVCRLMREGEVMCIPYQEQRYYVRRHRL